MYVHDNVVSRKGFGLCVLQKLYSRVRQTNTKGHELMTPKTRVSCLLGCWETSLTSKPRTILPGKPGVLMAARYEEANYVSSGSCL